MRLCVYTPVVVPPSAAQFVRGDGVEVAKHVPRAEMVSELALVEKFAPAMTELEATLERVGEVTTGSDCAVNDAWPEYEVEATPAPSVVSFVYVVEAKPAPSVKET